MCNSEPVQAQLLWKILLFDPQQTDVVADDGGSDTEGDTTDDGSREDGQEEEPQQTDARSDDRGSEIGDGSTNVVAEADSARWPSGRIVGQLLVSRYGALKEDAVHQTYDTVPQAWRTVANLRTQSPAPSGGRSQGRFPSFPHQAESSQVQFTASVKNVKNKWVLWPWSRQTIMKIPMINLYLKNMYDQIKSL